MSWSRESRHERGYGTDWYKLRSHVLAEEPLCRMCAALGRVTPATDLDHILPKAQGGTDRLDNLQPLCRACHDDKTRADNRRRGKVATGLDGWPIG